MMAMVYLEMPRWDEEVVLKRPLLQPIEETTVQTRADPCSVSCTNRID